MQIFKHLSTLTLLALSFQLPAATTSAGWFSEDNNTKTKIERISTEKKTEEVQVVLNTFKWFNEISNQNRKLFSRKDVDKYFTKDAKMITNNKLVCEGIKAHYDHFIELNEHYRHLGVDLNSIDARQAGDRVYLNYVIDGINLEGKPVKILVMGYMVIRENKIAIFNEVIAESRV